MKNLFLFTLFFLRINYTVLIFVCTVALIKGAACNFYTTGFHLMALEVEMLHASSFSFLILYQL